MAIITALLSDARNPSVTATTTATGFPASNTQNILRPRRIYKGTGAAGSERIIFDFGATVTIDAAVFFPNVSLLSFLGNATDSWGSPTFNRTILVNQDPFDKKHKVWVNLDSTEGGADDSWSTTGYRYAAIETAGGYEIIDGGADVLKMGIALFLGSYTEWPANPSRPFAFGPEDSVQRIDGPDGSPFVTALGPLKTGIKFNLERKSNALESTLVDLLTYGKSDLIVVYLNRGAATEEVYIGHRAFPAEFYDFGVNIGAQPLVIAPVV